MSSKELAADEAEMIPYDSSSEIVPDDIFVDSFLSSSRAAVASDASLSSLSFVSTLSADSFPGENAEGTEKTDLGVCCLSSLASSDEMVGEPEIGVTAFGVVFSSGRSLEGGIGRAREVEGLTGSESPPFNNSENDFCGLANEPNPLIEPLKAPNPSDFDTVGDGGDTGAKADFGPPRTEGDPNVDVLAGVVEGFT